MVRIKIPDKLCKRLHKTNNCLPINTTIRHIADALKLTPATVSRALHNHPRISTETKRLVLEAAKRMNYRRNKIASSVRTGRSHTIGVIIPSARMNFFGSVVHGIETLASKHGYHTLIYQTEESWQLEVKAIEAFLGARVDGILASLAKEENNSAHFKGLKKMNVPLVLFDRYIESLNIPSVIIDDYRGGFKATEHLIAQGYKRIAHIAGPQFYQTFQNRQKGYLDALRANNIIPEDSLIYSGDLSIESGKKAADYFLGLDNPPDAIFSVEDFSNLGLMKRLKEKNIRIPQDVGIIGFANEDFNEHTTPTLSSIDQQTVQMGREAFRMLLQLIENKTQQTIPSQVVLEPIPFFRESSQRNGLKHPTETISEHIIYKNKNIPV